MVGEIIVSITLIKTVSWPPVRSSRQFLGREKEKTGTKDFFPVPAFYLKLRFSLSFNGKGVHTLRDRPNWQARPSSANLTTGSGPRPLSAENTYCYTTLYKMITEAATRAKLDGVTWHTLRHTYRSWLDETGAPMTVQQNLMRHSDIRTTMNIYGDALPATLRAANSRVARMVLPN